MRFSDSKLRFRLTLAGLSAAALCTLFLPITKSRYVWQQDVDIRLNVNYTEKDENREEYIPEKENIAGENSTGNEDAGNGETPPAAVQAEQQSLPEGDSGIIDQEFSRQ